MTKKPLSKKKLAVFALFIVIATLLGFLCGAFFGMGLMTHSIERIASAVHVENIEIGFNETELVQVTIAEMEKRGVINGTE